MKKDVYEKLVRDKIPDIIKQNGDIPDIEIMDDETYVKKLDEKLLEECNELVNASDKKSIIDESADVLEVMYAKAEAVGVTKEEIEKARLEKQQKRGGFKQKILLKSTMSK